MVISEAFFLALNKGVEFFSKGDFFQEFSKARADFFENSGVLDEEVPNYKLRSSQFLDWYFFSRFLEAFRLPPSHCLFMLPDLRWTAEEEGFALQLKKVQHTFFEVTKSKGHLIIVNDLFSEKKRTFDMGSGALLFEKGQIFDGRFLEHSQGDVLFKGICFHPQEANPFIKSEVKRYHKNKDLEREKLLLATLKMRYLAERYPNAKIDQIYNWKNRWIENEFRGQSL